MRRRKLLSRKANLKPKVAVKKRNVSRHAAEWRRAYGSPERADFVNWLACVVCGYSPCENAHIENGGMGRKADARFVVPLCPKHHREQEGRTEAFQAQYGIDLYDYAAKTEAAWQAHHGGTHDEEPE